MSSQPVDPAAVEQWLKRIELDCCPIECDCTVKAPCEFAIFVRALSSALTEAQGEQADTAILRAKMADLLTRTAIAIRGEPPPLHSYGWSDLPERAAALKAELTEAHRHLGTALGIATDADYVDADAAKELAAARAYYEAHQP